MRIPPNCQQVPIKSILKTSTAYPSPYEDHQHHFIQQNPRSTAKENGEKESHEKSAWVQLLEEDAVDGARKYEEDRIRRLQEDLTRTAKYQADHARRLEEHKEYWAKRKEDRAQQEQRKDERYEREIKVQNERFELFLEFVTGCLPIKIPPASTPICIINSSSTTSIRPDIPNIKNTTTVHTTNTTDTKTTNKTHTTPTDRQMPPVIANNNTNKKKKKKK